MAGFEVVQLPVRSDNFAVLLHAAATGETILVDAPDAALIEAALDTRGWRLTHILVTHHHADHVAGLPRLKETFGAQVIGPEHSAAHVGHYDRTVSDGDDLEIAGHRVRVIGTPGHTLDHLSFWFPDDAIVFTGDALFSLGCGRVLEGTPEMLWQSLQLLRDLPDDTAVYCGHEYTEANARFALSVDGDNSALKRRAEEVKRLRAEGRATLPTTIGAEKLANPFLRADTRELAAAVGEAGSAPADVFAAIRKAKDQF